MGFTFNFYSIILIFCGAITLFLSYYVYNKKEGVRVFGIMMVCNAIWSLGYGFELASTTLHQAKFFVNIEYIGITTLPICWFVFCLKLSGKERWYHNNFNLGILVFFPLLTMMLVWTNQYHHLHYKDSYMDLSGEFPTLKITPGISYRLFTVYFYTVLAIGSFLLINQFRRADPVYKKQHYSIIIAALIPWIFNIAYLLGFRPAGNIDLTPFAFIATLALISIALFRFKLFDILPVVREKVLELMQDGFVVLDNRNRVIDYNLAFEKYLSNGPISTIIGKHISDLLPQQIQLIDFLERKQSGKLEILIRTPKGDLDTEADVRFLNEHQLNIDATILKLQDLTTLREEALRSRLQAEELQRLNQLKDRIFSIISHDLRGPLVNLSEVLKMTTTGQITNEEFKLLSPTLSKDILYTTELLENILHWSRSQMKGYGINKEFFDLKGIIVNEVNYHLPSATSKELSIVQDVFPGALVYADMLMIQIVVRNILNNAIKFCNACCEIQINAVYDDNFMRLCISDNGIGMSPEMLKALNEGGNLSTRGTINEKGTGLGLVVCREFIEKNGGKLLIESSVGKGSSFSIFIPVKEEMPVDGSTGIS